MLCRKIQEIEEKKEESPWEKEEPYKPYETTITEEDLYSFPKGAMLVKFASKLHLIS